MHMWFWLGSDLGAFLFPWYNVNTVGGLVATCFALAALAILYEGMKILQIKLRHFTMVSLSPNAQRNSESFSLLHRIHPTYFRPTISCHCASWSRWTLEVFHWSVHTLLGYLFMLAIMTYNGYISIALALGSCLGYWIFGPSINNLKIKHFQAKSRIINCTAHCADALISPERRESDVSVVYNELETVIEANVEVHVPDDAIL